MKKALTVLLISIMIQFINCNDVGNIPVTPEGLLEYINNNPDFTFNNFLLYDKLIRIDTSQGMIDISNNFKITFNGELSNTLESIGLSKVLSGKIETSFERKYAAKFLNPSFYAIKYKINLTDAILNQEKKKSIGGKIINNIICWESLATATEKKSDTNLEISVNIKNEFNAKLVEIFRYYKSNPQGANTNDLELLNKLIQNDNSVVDVKNRLGLIYYSLIKKQFKNAIQTDNFNVDTVELLQTRNFKIDIADNSLRNTWLPVAINNIKATKNLMAIQGIAGVQLERLFVKNNEKQKNINHVNNRFNITNFSEGDAYLLTHNNYTDNKQRYIGILRIDKINEKHIYVKIFKFTTTYNDLFRRNVISSI